MSNYVGQDIFTSEAEFVCDDHTHNTAGTHTAGRYQAMGQDADTFVITIDGIVTRQTGSWATSSAWYAEAVSQIESM